MHLRHPVVTSRAMYKWVVSHICDTHQTEIQVLVRGSSRVTYEWVMTQLQMSHGKYTNESCHTYKWVSHVTHIRMSYVTLMITCTIELCQTYECMYECVMSHIYEWVLSHIWLHVRMSHVTHDEPCHIYNYINEWFMSRMWIHIRMSHVTHIRMSHATHMITYKNESCHMFDTAKRKLRRSSEEGVMDESCNINESYPQYEWVMLTI